MKITFDDKTQAKPYDKTKFNAQDANEIKASVNALYDEKADATALNTLADNVNEGLASKVDKTELPAPYTDEQARAAISQVGYLKIESDPIYSADKPNIALKTDLTGLASENYVNDKVAGIVHSAPETLDTLNELATALGNDPNFATTVLSQIGQKVSKTGNETISGIKTFTDGLALGNLIKPYYVETTNDGGIAGYCKFIEVTLTALGQGAGMSCEYYTLSSGALTGERFTVNLIVSQRSAMGTNPSCSFWATSLNGGFDGARFMLVISETSATKTVVQIYAKNTDINQNFRIIPNQVSNPDAIKFFSGEPIIQTLPAGAKLFCATTSLIGQEVIVGNKQVIGGSGQVYTDNLYERTAGKGVTVNGLNLYTLRDNLSTLCQGRLTLQGGVAVPNVDINGQPFNGTTYSNNILFFTPYGGNKIPLYDGIKWNIKTFSEVSLALSGLTSGKNYDVFAYDNNGIVTLELSSAWSDETTRTDELISQDGAYVKSTDKTRLYLGSFRATSATTTEDSAVKRFVYNYYNKVQRSLFKVISATTWTYGTSAWVWRYANNDSTYKVEMLDGIGGALADVSTSLQITAVSGSFGYVSVGFNSGTANGSSAGSSVTGGFTQPSARLVKALNKGLNYFSTLETASSSTPVTFSSSNMCRMIGVVTM